MTQIEEPSTPTTVPMRPSDPDPINRRQQAPAPTPAPAKAPKAPKPRKQPKASSKDDGNLVTDYLGSREGRATVNNVVRGVFDLLKKRR